MIAQRRRQRHRPRRRRRRAPPRPTPSAGWPRRCRRPTARTRPTWRPSRGCRGSRRTSRRRGRASPGSRSGRRPTSRGRRRRRRRGRGGGPRARPARRSTSWAMSLSGVQTRILLDPGVRLEAPGRGRDRVVGLELDHRPEHDAQRLDRGLGDGELVEELGRHPGRRLVAGEEVVAERLDHPVRGAADVRGALLAEQVQELVAQPRDARQVDPVAAEDRRARRVERAEQLVGGVDEVDLHRRVSRSAVSPRPTRRAGAIAPGRPGTPRRGPGTPTRAPRLREHRRDGASRPSARWSSCRRRPARG